VLGEYSTDGVDQKILEEYIYKACPNRNAFLKKLCIMGSWHFDQLRQPPEDQ